MKRFRLIIFFLVLILLLNFTPACIKTGLAVEETTNTGEAVLSEEETTLSIEEEEVAEEKVAEKEEEEEEEAREKEEPTINISIYEGPTYSAADSVCYYRVRANVTGSPSPDVDWSKDDSDGAWGTKKTQVNLEDPGDTYTLTATATNSEGTDTDSIELSWSCEEEVTASEEEGIYSGQMLEYFFEIAFSAEYGSSGSVLHKWANDIRIKINGSPSDADLETLNHVVVELNNLSSSTSFSIVTDNKNADIYFTNVSQFSSIEPNYISGNMGFCWVWWDAAGDIFKANILIALDVVNQQERSHLIREELTQSTGLMNDSWRYQESIFYQGWTSTEEYSQIDRTIIELLYDPRLRSGMTQEQVKDVLGID